MPLGTNHDPATISSASSLKVMLLLKEEDMLGNYINLLALDYQGVS
jgi:hypothetical protein